jgi:hypothetical protein
MDGFVLFEVSRQNVTWTSVKMDGSPQIMKWDVHWMIFESSNRGWHALEHLCRLQFLIFDVVSVLHKVVSRA